MDWSQTVSSIVGMILVLTAPVGWIIGIILKLDKRVIVLEIKSQLFSKTLDKIDKKVSNNSDDLQIIKVAIAKIETVLGPRPNDSIHN